MLKISRVYSPILLLFKQDPDIVVPLVHQAASKKHVSIIKNTHNYDVVYYVIYNSHIFLIQNYVIITLCVV